MSKTDKQSDLVSPSKCGERGPPISMSGISFVSYCQRSLKFLALGLYPDHGLSYVAKVGQAKVRRSVKPDKLNCDRCSA